MKSRGTVKPTSATSYDFTWEIAPHGTDWTLIQQGKATKAALEARQVTTELANDAGDVVWLPQQRHGGENLSDQAVELIAVIPKGTPK